MTIFQKSVTKKHLDNLDKEQVENAYKKFRENYSPTKIEEIKKLKVTLKGELKEDWFERFNRLKAEDQTLKAEINKTDKEIDKMVYELYGLTEEDIKIVEGSE